MRNQLKNMDQTATVFRAAFWAALAATAALVYTSNAFAQNSSDTGGPAAPDVAASSDTQETQTSAVTEENVEDVGKQPAPPILLAQDNTSSQSFNGTGNQSTTTFSKPFSGELSDEKVAVIPQVGVVEFPDQNGNHTTRASAGLLAEGNLATWGSFNPKYFFIGPQTGAIFSHLGNTTSNFIGTSPTSSNPTDAGANFLMIPADLKIGYNIWDRFRISAHGGGNLTYRSVGNAIDFGPNTASTSSVWRIYPNVGGDVEIGFGQNILVNFRPDATITPGNTLLAGTIGLGILFG